MNKPKLLEYTGKVFERMGALSPVQARELIEERKQRLLYPSTQADGGLLPEHRIEPEIEPDDDDSAT